MKTISPKPIQSQADAQAFVDSLDISALKLGLSRIQELMATLGDPQDSLPTIHIAGTNGKGSTAAMLTAILKEAGYKVGTFISPHLVDIRERISVNGEPISQRDFQQHVALLAEHLDTLAWPPSEWPTHFEFINAMAYLYFKSCDVDIAVIEVGLGGRLDSTNIVKAPLVSVITSIGMDHQERLGNTLAAIAGEKAGIIKAHRPVVIGSGIPKEALSVIQQTAKSTGASLLTQTTSDRVVENPSLLTHSKMPMQQVVDTKTGTHLALPLMGVYQRANLATVLEVVDCLRQQDWEISAEALKQGLAHTVWPARFQYMADRRLVVDGSHNPDGFETLQQSVAAYFSTRPLHWVLSLRENRDPESLIQLVLGFKNTRSIAWTQVAGKVYKATPNRSLYHPPAEMANKTRQMAKALGMTSVAVNAYDRSQEALTWISGKVESDPHSLGIITGSLYTAGEALSWIQASPISN